MLLKKANTITTPTAYSNGFLHSVKPEVVWETFYESDFSVPYTGFISNLIGTTGESIAGVNDAIKLTLNNGLANHDIVPILNNVPLLNLDIRLSFDYYIPSTNAQLNGIFNFNTFSSSSHPNLRFQEIDKWTSVVVTGKTVTSGNVDLYFRALSGTSQTFSADGDVFYLKNIKVEIDISADFTFTRNSSATRVNELGYIEDVQIIGGELVSNGDFEEIGSELVTNGSFDTDSDWLKLNSTISDGKGNLDGTGVTSMLYQGILTNGLFYKATFTISNYNLIGNADIINASGVPYYVISSEGTFTIYFKHNDASSNFYFRARNGAIFSIDNVSVKEVGQDWIVLDTDATHYVEFSEEGARYVSDTTSPVLTLRQNISITSGTKYRFTIKLKNNGGTGNIKVQQTGITFVPNILDGTYTEDIVATANVTAVNIVRASTDVDLYIESFSIKEVTDDTNLPRINYEGFTYENGLPIYGSGKGHLLLEPQRSNLITYSEDFESSDWSKTNITIDNNISISPDGNVNASRVNSTTTASGSYAIFNSSNVSGALSYFAKDSGGRYFVVIRGPYANNDYAIFDLENGVISKNPTYSGSTAEIENYGNGWYRCILYSAQLATVNAFSTSGSGTSLTVLASGTIDIYGAQLEQNATYATSYIPTNGTAVTRLGETCKNAGNSDLFDSTEGVLYAEISADVKKGETPADIRSIYLSDGSDANRVVLRFWGSTQPENTVNFLIQSTGSSAQQQNITMPYNITNFNKYAIRWKNNEVTFFANGFEVGNKLTSFTTFTSGTLNDITFDRASGTEPFYGKTKMVATFPYLSNDEMECLTGEGYGTFEALAAAYSYTIK